MTDFVASPELIPLWNWYISHISVSWDEQWGRFLRKFFMFPIQNWNTYEWEDIYSLKTLIDRCWAVTLAKQSKWREKLQLTFIYYACRKRVSEVCRVSNDSQWSTCYWRINADRSDPFSNHSRLFNSFTYSRRTVVWLTLKFSKLSVSIWNS